jgi:hypothetical protein
VLLHPGGVSLAGEVEGTEPNEHGGRVVTTVRLDKEFATVRSVPFLKIDTEGNEMEVLKSAEGLLARKAIKSLVVEFRPGQVEMARLLYSHGFRCLLVDHVFFNLGGAFYP